MNCNNKNLNFLKKLTLFRKSLLLLLLSSILVYYCNIEICYKYPNKLIHTIKLNDYFDFILGLNITIIGFTLTILSIFGVGFSNSINNMNTSHIEEYLNDILDVICLSVSIIILTIYIDCNKFFCITGPKNIFNLIWTILLIFNLMKTLKLIIATFLMFSLNLLSQNKKDEEAIIEQKKQDIQMLETLSKIITLLEKIESDNKGS